MTVHPAPFIPSNVWATKDDDTALTISTDAYSAGQVVGGLLQFAVEQRATAPAGLAFGAMIVDSDDVGGEYTLYLFNDKPTVINDGAAFATNITAADLKKQIGQELSIDTYTDHGSLQRSYTAWSANEEPHWRGGDGNIYGYLVAAGEPDFDNTDALSVGLACWRY